MKLTMAEQIVHDSLLATRILSYEGKGLPVSCIREMLVMLTTDPEGYSAPVTLVDAATSEIASLMRETDLVIEHEGVLYWKTGNVDSANLN